MNRDLLSLTTREANTVLAALRYWQHRMDPSKPNCRFNDCLEIACGDDGEAPLSSAEIDQLCEQVNCVGDD